MSDLTKATKEELQAELERRAEEEREASKRKIEAKNQLIVQYIDVLLAFVPEHGRTSCSDKHYINVGRCTRCDLLEISRTGVIEDDKIISVLITNQY